MRYSLLLIAGLAIAIQPGCGDYQPAAAPSNARTSAPNSPARQDNPAQAAASPTAESEPAPSIATQALVPGAFVDVENPQPARRRAARPVAVPPATSTQPTPPAVDTETERVKAEAGVGKKGRGYGGGIVTEPVRIRFHAEQRIDFMNMQHTLDLYKAEHNRLPRTQEEFMKEIIQAGAIQLPELPEGERYVYDPKTGELMVERPAPGQPALPQQR